MRWASLTPRPTAASKTEYHFNSQNTQGELLGFSWLPQVSQHKKWCYFHKCQPCAILFLGGGGESWPSKCQLGPAEHSLLVSLISRDLAHSAEGTIVKSKAVAVQMELLKKVGTVKKLQTRLTKPHRHPCIQVEALWVLLGLLAWLCKLLCHADSQRLLQLCTLPGRTSSRKTCTYSNVVSKNFYIYIFLHDKTKCTVSLENSCNPILSLSFFFFHKGRRLGWWIGA